MVIIFEIVSLLMQVSGASKCSFLMHSSDDSAE